MNSSEFDIIKKYFSCTHHRDDVLLAGGDDCAVVSPSENKGIVITTDTLISGVHFPKNTRAEDVAYKALMVNLSDLAAMGATPAWITLAISLPEINENWLAAFSSQLNALLAQFNISLIGGDTTKGPLSITIQAMGLADKANIMRRDAALPGDVIYVTGDLGDAAIGLQVVENGIDDNKLSPCLARLNRPQARIQFAQQLCAYAKCAIDISDGLVADLGHVVESSHCGALVRLSSIPLSVSAKHYFSNYHDGQQANDIDWSIVLTQGDDYELCFTVNRDDRSAVEALARTQQLKLSCIGEITDSDKLHFIDENNKSVSFSQAGFNHFKN